MPTTVGDPSVGMIEGIQTLCQMANVTPDRLDHVLHGTTIATNTLLTHEGARVGMITTAGYPSMHV